MSVKVVFNNCYGGFNISLETTTYMALKGNHEAQSMLDEYNKTLSEAPEGWEEDFYGFWEGDRHDPILVEAVEKFKDIEANLSIKVLKYGTRYLIKEYDGLEIVIEPESIKWINVQL